MGNPTMRFICPQCGKTTDIERSRPDHEIVAVYCLHRDRHFGGGSEPLLMELVPASVSTPAAVAPEAVGAAR